MNLFQKIKFWLFKKKIKNKMLCEKNQQLLLKLLARKSPQVPGILLVANKLQKIGGVETRIRALTDALQHAGYQVYILTEINGNQFEINANLLEFSFCASNFEQVLCAAIEKLKIKVVEFQCKNVSFLRQLDLDKLKKYAVCGCTIHFCGKLPFREIRQLDYRIFISERMKAWYRKKIPYDLKNAIFYNGTNILPATWKFAAQKRAIYISRIGKAYRPKIEQFIKFCQQNNLDFHIAGDGRNQDIVQEIRKTLSKKYGFPENRFIGAINVLEYLSENSSEYLFAAGVGQVVLECSVSGMPVLVLSDLSLADATFVTPENYSFFQNRNFTIRGHKNVIRNRNLEHIADYPIRKQLAEDRDQVKISAAYVDFIKTFDNF